ncbi:MAG: tRNA (adenine(22)-N(1))-methyltransferase [Christensenellales bacterium]
MKIGERLSAAASLLPNGGVIADVGCDHGRLALWLYQTGRYEKIIATDISSPSLEKAKALAQRYGAPIDCRLGDGLSALEAGEAGGILMAGWGGLQIYGAIANRMQTAKTALLVLQPMTHGGDLRCNLVKAGFGIMAETLCRGSRGRLYEAFSVQYGRCMAQKDPFIIALGPMLYEQKHPLLIEKVDKLIITKNKTLNALKGKETAKAHRCRNELNEETVKLNEVKKWLSAKTY